MAKYHVHVYPIVRVTVREVEADNPEEACRKAEKLADLENLFHNVGFNPSVTDIEYADDIDGFWVDEDGDTEHERSRNYDAEYRPA